MAEIEETIIEIGKDILVSLVILGIILASLYAFSGRWPPMVVIESGSMMHSEESQIGVIDPGDIVIVQESDKEDITTYVEGRNTGYKKYGQYGDVIIFEPDGDRDATPIIHRAVVYLEYDEVNSSFNIPSLEGLKYGEDWTTTQGDTTQGLDETITIHDYGYADLEVTIDLSELNDSGFITMGDDNMDSSREEGKYDQAKGDRPVKEEWIKGRARGELPWFGIIKLVYLGRTEHIPSNSWNNFMISIAIILLLPVIAEIGSKIYHELVEKESGEDIDNQSSRKAGDSEDNEVSNNPRINKSKRKDREKERTETREEQRK